MQKTSDQIYDEVEAQWMDSAASKKKKKRQRIGAVVGLVVAGTVCVYWSMAIAHEPIGIVIAAAFSSFALSEMAQRWALEDRVEALESERKQGLTRR